MTAQEIPFGTRLELKLLNEKDEKAENTYISQFLEQLEGNSIVISSPIFEARLIYIPLHARIYLTFAHTTYGLLGFTAVVTGRKLKCQIAALIIQPEGALEKIQRRMYYRQNCFIDVFLQLDKTGSNTEGDTVIKATTKNMSGSGACIVTAVDIPENSEVNIEIPLENNIKINAKCVVIRSIAFEVKKNKSYELGIHFNDISTKDRECLIKYLFEQQRKQLKPS